ncbi:hypothetical protein SDC9_211890 [bioreactor metagenome]|uniref:Uncharacterized protein n=1 Tax=bioreactor metagenome TaxID=1076179 RepID=A0A645JMY7_9ZZZZ
MRQSILTALHDSFGPQKIDIILKHNAFFGLIKDRIIDEIEILRSEGFLESFPDANDYVRLTDKGKRQVEFQEAFADRFIWGPKALR